MPIWDPFVPVERYIQRGLARMPPSISHWLGYRQKSAPPSPTWIICLWGFIGAFCGLSVILAIFGHTEYFRSRAVPPIIASFVRFYINHINYYGVARSGLWTHTNFNRAHQRSSATAQSTSRSPNPAPSFSDTSSRASPA
jgi:hypothetical protein